MAALAARPRMAVMRTSCILGEFVMGMMELGSEWCGCDEALREARHEMEDLGDLLYLSRDNGEG